MLSPYLNKIEEITTGRIHATSDELHRLTHTDSLSHSHSWTEGQATLNLTVVTTLTQYRCDLTLIPTLYSDPIYLSFFNEAGSYGTPTIYNICRYLLCIVLLDETPLATQSRHSHTKSNKLFKNIFYAIHSLRSRPPVVIFTALVSHMSGKLVRSTCCTLISCSSCRGSCLALIFPVLIEMATFWKMKRYHLPFHVWIVKDIIILCIGVVGGVLGTAVAIYKIAQTL